MPPLRLRTATVISALTLAAAGCDPTFPEAPAVVVTLDPATPGQQIDGIGGSAANEAELRAMPEPDRSAVLDLVFGDLAPSVVRIKPRPAIEPANDNADPALADPAGFVRPADHLWQLDEIFARGEPKLIAALWTPPAWMKTTGQENGGGSLLPGMDAELAEFFSAYLGFLEAEGRHLEGLSIQNEPEAAPPWDSNTYGPADYAETAEKIAQRFVAEGRDVRLTAPDTAIISFVPLFLQFLLAKPTATARLGAVAYHYYQYDYYQTDAIAAAQRALSAGAPAGLPLWMTEYSNTTGQGYGSWDEGLNQAVLIHEAFANGASMYVMWNLYRPGGPGEALVVIPTQRGVGGYTVTPKYWTLRQFTKYVRPGARRIGAASEDPEVLASAYRDAAAGTLTAVLINRRDEARWALLGGALGTLGPPARVVRSSASESGVELAPDSGALFGPRAVHLPARSVTTVVWPDFDPS